ncbi:hypothetical protein V6N11_036206 [Hibiscus sabdariffa]|uniref:Uncharacterized protein n=1 Tax=Hibiscus sabdariffa TaxID=183260 RepID=A0ABR2R9Q9_9ROSI
MGQLSSVNFSTRKPRTHTLFTAPKRFQVISGCLGERSSPAKTLRQILESPGIHQGPACFDGLRAKLVERAGFQCCLIGGFSSAGVVGFQSVNLFCSMIGKLLVFVI